MDNMKGTENRIQAGIAILSLVCALLLSGCKDLGAGAVDGTPDNVPVAGVSGGSETPPANPPADPNDPPTPTDTADPETYVTLFQTRASEVGKTVSTANVSVVTADLKDQGGQAVAARCEKPKKNAAYVLEVDAVEWALLLDVEREIVVMHELGHCVLGRGEMSKQEDGRPVSVMNAQLVHPEVYEAHYWEYMDELFSVVQ